MHGRRKVKPALISLAFLISGAMPGLPAGEPTFPATPEPYRRGQGVLYFQADGSIDKVCFLWNEREYEIPADYRWTAPLENNLNWQHGMASLRWLRCALEMASSSAPAEDLLREFLLSFYDQHFQSGKVTTPHYYGDHTWAVRQRFLTDCYLFYRHRNGSPPEFRERLYAMLEEHARISSRPGRVYLRGIYNNHQVMLSHSLLYAAVKCPELNIDREEVVRRLRDQINNIFTGNGVTREHSADYQLYNLGITIDCYNLMKEAQLDVRELGDILTRSQEFIAYLILPDYTMPAFGDSRVPYPLEAAHRLARTLDDPANELVRVLDKGGGLPLRYETILWPQANIAVIRQFDRRKSLVHLLFMASHFGVTHKHDDDLSFTFYGNGRRFLIDTGYDDLIVHDARKKQLISDYDKPVAHNVVIARGVSWSNRNLTGLTRLTGYGKSSSAVILQGEHHRIPGVRLQRTLFLFEELNLFVIDRISSDTSQDFSQLFHIDPGLILTEKDSSYLCTAADPDFEGIITPLTPCDRQIIHRGVNAKPRSYVFRNREIVNTATIELIRKARQECEMITLIQIVPPSTRKTDTLSKPEIRLENDTVYLKYKQNKRYHEHQLRLRKIDSTEPIRLP